MSAYDEIGADYTRTRRPDPRIEDQIHAALSGCRTVLNVGAGAGSYEPMTTVAAVDPSTVMIKQRAPGSAPCVQAFAEALPFRDECADAAMAVLTLHHWSDIPKGVAELRRVARRRVIIMTWDQTVTCDFWLLREYLPAAASIISDRSTPLSELVESLGDAQVQTVPVPWDCTDGFVPAFWRRPEAYLDRNIRSGMSMLALAGEDSLQEGLSRLASDLQSGGWRRHHSDLLEQDRLDVGCRLLVGDVS